MIHESLTSGQSYLLFALAFVLFLILPGWLAARLLFGRRVRDPFVMAPLAASLGVALMSFWCLAGHLAGAGARAVMVASSVSTVALLAFNVVLWVKSRAGKRRAGAVQPRYVDAESYGAVFRMVVCGLLAAVFVLVLSRGAVFTWVSDSPDHVGTIREIVESDRIFPTNSFYAGDEGLGADPRKGLYHTAIAILSVATGIEPYRIWVWLPSLLFPLLLLSFFAFTKELLGDRRTALVASILFVVCIEGIGRFVLTAAGFPANVAWMIYLMALFMTFRYLRSLDWRYLAGAAILGSATGTVHIYYFFQFGLALIAFLLFAVVLRRQDRVLIVGIIKTGIAAAVLSIPFLAVKYSLSYSVANPFDEQLRWVLYLSERWYVVNPVEPWHLVGPMAVFALALTPLLFTRARENKGFLFLFATMVTTPLIIYNPLAVVPLGEFMTTGLVRRVVFLAPYMVVLGFFTARALDAVVSGPNRRSRVWAVVFLVVLAVLLVPYVGRMEQNFSGERRDFDRAHSPFVWYDVLQFMKGGIDTPSVVLSDPWTSYSVPAFTTNYIVAVPIGHSSPKDARNVFNVRDAMDVLNPYIDLETTRTILYTHDVDYIVLNETFNGPVVEYGWALHPNLYAARRAKFDSNPGLFDPVYDVDGVRIYRYLPDGEAAGVEAPELPFVSKYRPRLDQAVDAVFEDRFVLLGAVTDRDVVQRGESIRLTCYWQKKGIEDSPAYYRVFARFDTDYSKDPLYRPAWSKLYRYGLQKRKGERYRFRVDHNPVNGVYPPYRWRPGEVIEDEIVVRVPTDVAPGRYDIKIKLRAVPFSPNYYIADFLCDDDVYSGVKAASIEITR